MVGGALSGGGGGGGKGFGGLPHGLASCPSKNGGEDTILVYFELFSSHTSQRSIFLNGIYSKGA